LKIQGFPTGSISSRETGAIAISDASLAPVRDATGAKLAFIRLPDVQNEPRTAFEHATPLAPWHLRALAL
jgi:hypothetical protein